MNRTAYAYCKKTVLLHVQPVNSFICPGPRSLDHKTFTPSELTDGVASVDARIYSYAWYLVSVDGRARTARRTRCKIHHTSTYSFNTFIHQSIKYFILSVHSGNMWKLLQVQLAEHHSQGIKPHLCFQT